MRLIADDKIDTFSVGSRHRRFMTSSIRSAQNIALTGAPRDTRSNRIAYASGYGLVHYPALGETRALFLRVSAPW